MRNRMRAAAIVAAAGVSAAATTVAAQERCAGLLRPACLEQLGAGAAALPGAAAPSGDCAEQLRRYRSCLADAAKASAPAADASVFEGYGHGFGGGGCDSQCLPIFYLIAGRDGGAIDVEIYNRAFGLVDVAGEVAVGEAAAADFELPYIPGGHEQTILKLSLPRLQAGDALKVCMKGLIEGKNTPIAWSARYQYVGAPETGYGSLKRISPVSMATGAAASACPGS